MKSEPPREEALFQAAAQLSGAERASFLKGACCGDAALRQRLDSLLAAHDQSEGLRATAAPAAKATIKLEFTDKPVDEAVGQTIGRYKLLQRIGEGGCGVVYMAEQEEPVRRRVALKVIKPGMDTKQVLARFEAERQALALMDHPNIAKVFDGGVTETGRPFFVMELVKGIRITEYCDENKFNTQDRLALFNQVCQAIQHAHQKGIVHRDIKPSNILVADHDGVPVAKVIDFGIAKATSDQRLTDKTLFTALEQFIGTPAYMSPEQARMSGLDIDTRSDIYSLGVLLYELLTGKTPFDAKRLLEAGVDEIRRIIREEEPPRPSTRLSTLNAAEQTILANQRHSEPLKLLGIIRGDLDWIVMKTLEKDRNRRYETANGLAMDIQRYLNSEPIIARPPSQLYRFQKMVRRNRLIFTSALIVSAALLFGLTTSIWQAMRALRSEREERQLRGVAEKARKEAETALYRSRVTAALDAWSNGDIAETERLLDQCAADFRQWEWHYLKGLCHMEEAGFQTAILSPAAQRSAASLEHRVAFSPDSQRLITFPLRGQSPQQTLLRAELGAPSESAQPLPFAVWDLPTARKVFERVTHGTEFAFTPDGARFAQSGTNGGMHVWETSTGKEIVHLDLLGPLALRADGRELAVGVSNRVVLFDLPSGRQVGALETGLREIRQVYYNPLTNRLAAVGIQAVSGHEGVLDLNWTTNVFGCELWNLAAGKRILQFSLRTRPALLRFRGASDEIAVVDEGNKVLLWRPGEKKPWMTKLMSVEVRDLEFDQAGRLLWGCGVSTQPGSSEEFFRFDTKVAGWNFRVPGSGGEVLVADSIPGGLQQRLRLDPGLSHALRNTEEVKELGDPPGVLAGYPGNTRWSGGPFFGGLDLALAPGEWLAATAGMDRQIHVIHLQYWREEILLRGHRAPVTGVAFSPDGRRLASIDRSGRVKLWNAHQLDQCLVKRGQLLSDLPLFWADEGREPPATVSRDCSRVAGTFAQGNIGVLDLDRETVRNVASGFFDRPVISPDGHRILSLMETNGQVLKVFDADTGAELDELTRAAFGFPFVFSSSARFVAALPGDALAVWESSGGTYHPLAVATDAGPQPNRRGGGHASVLFSPDEALVAVDRGEGDVELHPILNPSLGARRFQGCSPLAFSADSRVLACAPADNASPRLSLQPVSPGRAETTASVRGLQFIDVASGHVLWKLPFAHPESARVWFSPDGRWLVVTPARGPATEVWSVKDRRRVWQIETGVRDVAFSPNSRRLVTATPDGFLRVWDLFAGEQVVALQADAVVTRFRPDGQRLLIITLNGAVAWLDGMPADAGH